MVCIEDITCGVGTSVRFPIAGGEERVFDDFAIFGACLCVETTGNGDVETSPSDKEILFRSLSNLSICR